MNIIFMGTPAFAAYQLEYLIEHNYPIKAVITVPDKPAGRGLKIQESDVKQVALKHQIKILQPSNLKDAEFIQEFKELEPDLAIVVAFRMLPKAIWASPKLGTFNLHASLLPDYRGAAPINHAIINGEKITGATTFLIDDKIDTGNILLKKEIHIEPSDNAGTLHDKLMKLGAPLIAETIDRLSTNNITPIPQIAPSIIKEAPKIFPENCILDFNNSVESVFNKVRGLNPYPGARIFCNWNGDEKKMMLKIFEAEIIPENSYEPGEIISDGKTYIYLQCKGGLLNLKEIQLEGKKRMLAEDLLRGMRDFPNKSKGFTSLI